MLSNKRCLITGASRGIGQAIALVYAKEGASLLLTGRDHTQLNATAEKCKALGASACDTVVADLTQPSEVERLAKVTRTSRLFPRHPLHFFCSAARSAQAWNRGRSHQQRRNDCQRRDLPPRRLRGMDSSKLKTAPAPL